MKIFGLTIVFLLLALIAFAASPLAKSSTPKSPIPHDYLHTEPFRGSQFGNTVARACGNCHSNETKLPWYAHVAPVSWWINSHVREGRQALNFSEWTTYSAQRRHNELESLCGAVSTGRMPPASYRVLHPEARLDAQDKKVICAWADNELDHEE